MEIPITFLGTSQAIPTARRNHTAMLLQYKSENILIDCGEGTQRQFRKANLNPCNLTRLLITHWHGDHILGIPGLLQTLALNGYKKTLHIYGPKGTSQFLALMLKMFVFVGKLKVEVKEIEGASSNKFEEKGKVLETQDFLVEAYPMQHGASCLAYSFIEKDKIRIDKEKLEKLKLPNSPLIKQLQLGKDITFQGKKISAKSITYEEKGKKIVFILDTGINEETYKAAKDADLLICESTFMEDSEKGKELAREYKHLTAKQAAEIAKIGKAKKLILTHLSQRYEGREKLILAEARKVFKNTEIAEDLMRIEV